VSSFFTAMALLSAEEAAVLCLFPPSNCSCLPFFLLRLPLFKKSSHGFRAHHLLQYLIREVDVPPFTRENSLLSPSVTRFPRGEAWNPSFFSPAQRDFHEVEDRLFTFLLSSRAPPFVLD